MEEKSPYWQSFLEMVKQDMSPETFDFTGLQNIYREALKSDDKTLAVDVKIGKGKFLLMMFLSDEDQDAKDRLYIFLGNMNKILRLKLYGSHYKGAFLAYINEDNRRDLINELRLEGNGAQPFDFNKFLNQLNASIPDSMPVSKKIRILRQHKDTINSISPFDDSDKTVFDGPMQLEKGVKKPKDKTLRKLYVYTDTEPEIVSSFIKILRSKNKTVRWTRPERKREGVNVESIMKKDAWT